MPIFIYNSLTRKKEEFTTPIDPPKVNIYTCGVTVYDESHIGHARSLYIFDVIRRYFKYRGYKVRFVRNITDIDDKIINRAKELGCDWKELIKKYIDRYYEDLKVLGIEKADFEPRATENIDDMVKYIEGLVKKRYAYETKTGVYFSVRKFPDYGKLSGQSIKQMLTGVRKEPDETKEDPLDFALWKKSKEGEPSWDSHWGAGRPGWHIECSTMSMKYLKTETLDIHGGGIDLIFPHHENEIAQAQAATGKLFVKYWIHHGLLTIDGQKMAKSLGNFVTIKDFMNKYNNVDLLKLFFLSAHYSSPIDYTEVKIEEAKQALERIVILLGKIDRRAGSGKPGAASNNSKDITEIRNKFITAMDDDFNTPKAMACVFDLVNLANKHIGDIDFTSQARNEFKEMLDIFGVTLKKTEEPMQISEKEIQAKILERDRARQDKDYCLADKIRKGLEEKGIILEDEKEKTIWRTRL